MFPGILDSIYLDIDNKSNAVLGEVMIIRIFRCSK